MERILKWFVGGAVVVALIGIAHRAAPDLVAGGIGLFADGLSTGAEVLSDASRTSP